MERNISFFNNLLLRCLWISLTIFLIGTMSSCTKYLYLPTQSNPSYSLSYQPQVKKWVNWNILFNPGTSASVQNAALQNITQYVTNYVNTWNTNHGTSFTYTPFYISCPCDPSLFNFTATPLAGSGSLPLPPPLPPKNVGGSGGEIDYVQMNYPMIIDSAVGDSNKIYASNKIVLNTTSIDSTKTLAVMDTGLDTALFQNNFHGLLWRDPLTYTIRNFQFFTNGRSLDDFGDDNDVKHGTAVTSLALEALENYTSQTQNNVKPLVMVLKVLDNNGAGSTFTVSCALSYTIQHQATIVNASLGYYSAGDVDSILYHYVQLTNSAVTKPIPIFAAAGNLPVSPVSGLACSPAAPGNELTLASPGTRLFFPACFNGSFSNVTAVTSLKDPLTACFYQNYSSTFVNLGVVQNPGSPDCCKFKVAFKNSGYIGSSFATPVVSGKVMGCLLTTPGTSVPACLGLVSTLPSPVPTNPATSQGKYLNFSTP